MHCSSLHCSKLVIKLNLKSAYLHGKLHISKKCITSSKNTKNCIPQKCIASRDLTKIAFLKHFQTQFKSAYRQILHSWSVHSSRVYCNRMSTYNSRQRVSSLNIIIYSSVVVFTVAVSTQNPFTQLLTRPQGYQGCQKIRIIFLQMKLLSSCTKIDPKRHKLRKMSKLEKAF